MRLFLLTSALLSATFCAHADTRILRFPDISATQVVFVYGGDIYTTARTGGAAQRLTSHAGMELFPKFSPDGLQVAFSAEYSGSRQVYVMPSDGSAAPKQLTWYNDVGLMPPRGGFDYRVLDWTPDGKNVVVRMNRLGFDERAGRPYLVPVAGGDEVALSVPETGGGMLSPDGEKFVYTPIDREFRTWKRTRGGRAQDVWVYDLAKNTSLRLTEDRATDNQPMWLGDSVFFTSDRNYTLNLFQVPPTGGTAKQVTQFTKFDVLWPSAGADAIVFENGGWLYTLAAGATEPTKLNITVSGDRPGTLPVLKNVAAQIEASDLSAAGERVIFSARGELFSVPRKDGVIRNLSNTPALREMSVALSPDGKTLAYLSDATGEYELYVRPIQGGEAVQVTKDGKSWRLNPMWAPDNSVLLLSDSENRLFLMTLDGRSTLIDQATRGRAISEYVFSPDSKHVAYVKANATSMTEIWWFNRATGTKQRVLGGQFDAATPCFDPAGRYLYFTSNRDHNLSYSSYEFNYLYTNAGRIFAARLSADAPPLMPQKSDEIGVETAKAEAKGESEKYEAKPAEIGALKIDLNGIENRVEALSIPGGNYAGLAASAAGVYFVALTGQGPAELKYFDLANAKIDTVAAGVNSFRLSANASTLLLNVNGGWVVTDAKPGADVSKALDLSALTLRIDPKIEWQQMYVDAWRVLREWFYDPGMHGNDWNAIREKYQPMLTSASHRSDLDYLLSEIAGEVNAGHIYVDRGDEPQIERKESGLLGAEFTRTNAGYRVSKIFPGQNWSQEFRSPFLDAGVDIQVGDVITAIDSKPALSVQNFYQLLEGKGARGVEIERVRSGNSKRVQVKTIVAETNLRYLDWIQTRSALVTKLSNGRIGYVHLPNTAIEGNRELFKQFPSQIDKEALIIDDRYNGGGFIPDRLIEILARKPLNYWKRRGLEPEATPLLSHNGPKAMLINGLSSSGGDALPYYFRKLGLGVIIGTRTWGGLIGISGNPRLADGGTMSAATFRILSTDNKWVVENEGVTPDIEVLDRPELIAAGADPSIERAVSELLKTLDANPKSPVVAPAAPIDFGRPDR